jgi:hypothetical protein
MALGSEYGADISELADSFRLSTRAAAVAVQRGRAAPGYPHARESFARQLDVTRCVGTSADAAGSVGRGAIADGARR